ncbi:hypothetical protein BDM02DRAFT_302987 [Thelephora ganbajun]|uniref:Uncharacterized protein n=1 Tax=Thelephora ganbajun TaxID=370292 RepID=A0ACB6Z947_THEGA|nr:hypothetical protein BDM02DRAFT_302987 [Thelephora ganbajun]
MPRLLSVTSTSLLLNVSTEEIFNIEGSQERSSICRPAAHTNAKHRRSTREILDSILRDSVKGCSGPGKMTECLMLSFGQRLLRAAPACHSRRVRVHDKGKSNQRERHLGAINMSHRGARPSALSERYCGELVAAGCPDHLDNKYQTAHVEGGVL